MKLPPKYIALGLIALILAIVLIPRLFLTEEDRIAKMLDRVEKALKSKNTEKVLQYISADYSDNYHRDLEAFKKNLKRLFDNSGPLHIEKKGLEIKIDQNSATATAFFIAKVSTGFGNNQFDLVEEFYNSNRFLVHLDKSSGRWKITQVENLPYTYD